MVREQHFNTREILPRGTVVSMDFILIAVEDCRVRALANKSVDWRFWEVSKRQAGLQKNRVCCWALETGSVMWRERTRTEVKQLLTSKPGSEVSQLSRTFWEPLGTAFYVIWFQLPDGERVQWPQFCRLSTCSRIEIGLDNGNQVLARYVSNLCCFKDI